MADVYLTEQGSVAHKVDNRIVVKKDGVILADIPLARVEGVRVIGRGVTLTTALLVHLMGQGIDTVFLSQSHRFYGRAAGGLAGHGALRAAQARAANNPPRALALARSVVRGKLVNQRFVLRRHGARLPLVNAAMTGIAVLQGRLDAAPSPDTVRGLEGQAAALYFGGLRALLRQDLGFQRRAHHPPTDPVNALLSFGYTLLVNDIVAAVQVVGLDPAVGFFHVPDGTARPALALDLEEEFRPIIVDSLVLALVNSRLVGPADFRAAEPGSPAVWLTDAARRLFVARYAARLATITRYPATGERTSYRRILELQVRALARSVEGDGPYAPFTAQ